MIFNTKRIHNSFWRNFPERAKQILQKFYLLAEEMAVQSLWAKIAMRLLATVNELKIIIFVLNYLTVFVYTKTISVGG